MNNITDIKKFKASKKAKVVYAELQQVIKIFDLTTTALRYFSKYSIVMEVISVLQSNRTLLEIHCKKYEKMIKSEKDHE